MRVILLGLMFTSTLRADEPVGAWTGPYPLCYGHAEVLKRGPMNLPVRFLTSNPKLKAVFARAMSFWAGILEMNWHEEDSQACAIQVVDGDPDISSQAKRPAPSFLGRMCFRAGSPSIPYFRYRRMSCI